MAFNKIGLKRPTRQLVWQAVDDHELLQVYYYVQGEEQPPNKIVQGEAQPQNKIV